MKQILQCSQHTKFLGVFLDNTLSWRSQVTHVSKKITVGMNYLIRIRHYFPKHILNLIYLSFIESHLSYGIEVWGAACPSILKPLYVLQKRALRIMNFLPPSASVSDVFPINGTLTLPQLAYFKLAVLLHKLTNNCITLPDIPINIDCRKISLRTSPDTLLAVDRAKTNYGKRRISFIGSQLWN